MSDTLHESGMGPAEPIVSHHFEKRDQQNEASFIGMWLFLAQEAMFFGGLFVAYAVYRFKFPEAWWAGSSNLNYYIGAGNTIVLLVSSLTMALTVWATQVGKRGIQLWSFFLTMVLGTAFLVVKYFEWRIKWRDGLIPGIKWHPDIEHFSHSLNGVVVDFGHVEMFYRLYFIMTGMHALHMVIGVAVGAVYFIGMFQRRFGPNKYLSIEFFGFYWHFVDIVWVFLFPMMYLVSHPAFPAGGGH